MDVDFFLSEEWWKAFRSEGCPPADSSAFRGEHPKDPGTVCSFCGLRESVDNPLQAAHRIPARAIVDFAVKPEILNRSDNFVWAHRRLCNDAVELRREQVVWRLMALEAKELPSFLPGDVREAWAREARGVFELPPAVKVEERRVVTPSAFPTVSSSIPVKREEYKPPDGVLSPPPPSALRSAEPLEPSGYVSVPPPSLIRRRKLSDESSETKSEEG